MSSQVPAQPQPKFNPIYGAKSLPDDFLKAISGLSQLLESRVLVFYVTNSSIDRDIVDCLFASRGLFQNLNELNIVLDCNGGDIDAAYQIVEFFRTHVKTVRVFVPRWAKSAATFICLGSDEIVMTEVAELGPLDAQVTDPRNPLRKMSALDGFKALEALRRFSMETFDLMNLNLIRKAPGFPLKDIISETDKFVAGIANPLFSKFDPLDIGWYGQVLRLGEEYLKRVIVKTPHCGGRGRDGQSKLIDEIIWKYPSHSFAINLSEARRLKLNVKPFSEEEIKCILPTMNYSRAGIDCIGFVELVKANAEPQIEAKQQVDNAKN